MDEDIGSGLSALCALVPGKKCNSEKKDNEYVNKVVEIPLNNSFEKQVMLNEVFISKLIYDRCNKSAGWLDEHFGLIEEHCKLKNIKKNVEKMCKLDLSKNYFIYVIKNVGCPPLVKGKQVRIYGSSKLMKVEKITKNSITVINKNVKMNIEKDDIVYECGDFSKLEVHNYVKNGGLKFVKKMFKKLINAVLFLHSINIVHCDLKHKNIVMDLDGNPRIIDFGSSINMKKLTNSEIEKLCSNINLFYSNKHVKTSIKNTFNGMNGINGMDGMDEIITKTIYGVSPFFAPPEIIIIWLKKNWDRLSDNELLNNVIDTTHLSDKKDIDKIKRLIKNKKSLIGELFCIENPLIYSYDIYSLGRLLKYISISCGIIDVNMEDLIKKMTVIDYKKRLPLEKCLKHSFLKGV